MLECCSIVSWCILSAMSLLSAVLPCSCFACHLQTVHPIPVIFISISTEIVSSFQRHNCLPSWWLVQSFPSGARICIAYHISHIMPCFASCCLCIASWLIVSHLLVFLLWVEPGDEYVIEEPIEYANEDQAFVNSENFGGKMTIPSKSLLSLLASCSLFCYAATPTTCYIMPSILPCQPLTHLF